MEGKKGVKPKAYAVRRCQGQGSAILEGTEGRERKYKKINKKE
jgi:hypothetical protein